MHSACVELIRHSHKNKTFCEDSRTQGIHEYVLHILANQHDATERLFFWLDIGHNQYQSTQETEGNAGFVKIVLEGIASLWVPQPIIPHNKHALITLTLTERHHVICHNLHDVSVIQDNQDRIAMTQWHIDEESVTLDTRRVLAETFYLA